jgi:hypothetical protein
MPAELRIFLNHQAYITKKRNPLEPLNDNEGIHHLPPGTDPSVRNALRDYEDAVQKWHQSKIDQYKKSRSSKKGGNRKTKQNQKLNKRTRRTARK